MNIYKKRAMKRLFGDSTPAEIQSVPNRTKILQLLSLAEDYVAVTKFLPESKTLVDLIGRLRKNYSKAENLKESKQLIDKMIRIAKSPNFVLATNPRPGANDPERNLKMLRTALDKIKELIK